MSLTTPTPNIFIMGTKEKGKKTEEDRKTSLKAMDKYYSIGLVWLGPPHLQLQSLKAYK